MNLLKNASRILVNLASVFKRRFFKLEYDSAEYSPEMYYAEIYHDYFKKYLPDPPASILDAGCGTGRFLIPLMEKGYLMTGIDYTKDSVRLITKKTQNCKYSPTIIDGDIYSELKTIPDSTFDSIISIEVLYCSKFRKEITEQMYRCLKPGGILLITHKPRFYFMLQSLLKGNYQDCQLISEHSEGYLLKGNHRVYYNWQTLNQIKALYQEIGATIENIVPIGPYSGFSVDPFSLICDPGKLCKKDQESLAKIEQCYDEDTLMASRYVLVSVRKKIVGM